MARWAAGRRMYNGYGPSEATIETSVSPDMRPGETVTVGGPAIGFHEVILDDHGGHMFVCSDTDNCEDRREHGHRGKLAGHALEAAE